MNTARTMRLGLLAALCACSFAATAQSADPAQNPAQSPDQAAVPEQQESVAVATINDGDEPATHPFCLRSTGTHIKLDDRKQDGGNQADDNQAEGDAPDCVIASGHVLTREELERSGAINITEALQRLSPVIY